MENTSEKTQIATENSDPKKEKKRLKALKPSQKIMLIAAVFVLAAAIVLTSVLIVRGNKKKRAAVIGETQTEAAVTDAELEVSARMSLFRQRKKPPRQFYLKLMKK